MKRYIIVGLVLVLGFSLYAEGSKEKVLLFILKSRHFIARPPYAYSTGTSSTSFLNRSFWVLVISVRTLL